MGRFGLSLATIKGALDLLKKEGVLESRQGSGLYVSRDLRVDRELILSVMPGFYRSQRSPHIVDGEAKV